MWRQVFLVLSIDLYERPHVAVIIARLEVIYPFVLIVIVRLAKPNTTSINFNMTTSDEETRISDEHIFYVELLITSIEQRPLLWNKTLNSYSRRNEKENTVETYIIYNDITNMTFMTPKMMNLHYYNYSQSP